MRFWIVTALNSDLVRCVVGLFATEKLAKDAVEMCDIASQSNEWGTYGDAAYEEVELQDSSANMQLILAELLERKSIDRASVFGAEKTN